MDDAKEVFRSNFRIQYNQLVEAIQKYKEEGHLRGETQYIESYLASTIHSIMDYAERYLKEDDVINACRYVNNTIKHNLQLISHKEITGGLEFPMSFPICVEQVEIVWRYDSSLSCRKPEQKEAFKKVFANNIVLDTLKPIAKMILDGEEIR